MPKVLDHADAVAMRREGMASMLDALAQYDANGEPVIVVIYPGGGWAMLNPASFDVNSELRKEAERYFADFSRRGSDADD